MSTPTDPRPPHPADVYAVDATSCPDCQAARGDRCRDSRGWLRARCHANRRILAEAIRRERLLAMHGIAPVAPKATAWGASLAWEREEAERLRFWLSQHAPMLWSRS